jgi:hypothetical protein
MGLSFPIVISFYTVDTLYQMEVQNLIASAEQYGVETRIVGVPSFGSWELNCAYKPFFILEQLKQLQRPVLWVDADGVFVKKPSMLQQFQADLAVRIEDNLAWDHSSKVITSTVFVNHTPEGVGLLRAWARECQAQLTDPSRTTEFWDQIALRNVLVNSKDKIGSLPLSYAKIFDHPEDVKTVSDPVIVHYQASRRYKNLI